MTDVPTESSNEWEAAQWVGRRMGGEPFDQDRFDSWLAGDPRRKALFDAMWQRIMGSGMDQTLDVVIRQRRSKNTLVAGSIAIALALLGGYQALPSVQLLFSEPQEYAAATGNIRNVTLEDGTLLTLAGGSAVRVRYAAHTRQVELTHGTIFANVTHDESRPFLIVAGDAQMTDLGTSFEVSSKPGFVRVMVESGAVRFGAHSWFSRQLDLTAHQGAVLAKEGLDRMNVVESDGVARWRADWVEYHDTPMGQVVADLESASPLPIKIVDSKLTNLRVSGRIRLTEPMRQIYNLSIIHNFSVEQRDGVVLLSERK